jgi:hypothetical protein
MSSGSGLLGGGVKGEGEDEGEESVAMDLGM